MSDHAFLYHVLEDGEWHGQDEILQRSQTERGYGLTVHSRAADLRKKGCVIQCQMQQLRNGRRRSFYRLVALSEPQARGSLSVPATPTPLGLPSTADESASPPVGTTAGTLPLFAGDAA